MSQLSPWLRMTVDGPAHWCPGCQEMHVFYVNRPTMKGARWSWNGDAEKPTFSPSMSITVEPIYEDDGVTVALAGESCHYFLKDGQIQFLADSSHALAGQTVSLPKLPE